MGALCEHQLAAEPRPETRSQPTRLQGKGREKKGSTFSEQEEGEAMSVSCCAAETSKDVITFTLPQGVSRLRAKVQSFPMHCEEGGFGGETSSGFIANSSSLHLHSKTAKQRVTRLSCKVWDVTRNNICSGAVLLLSPLCSLCRNITTV